MIFTIIFLLLGLLFISWILSSPFRWMNKGIKWYLPWPVIGNTATVATKTFPGFWMDFYNKEVGEEMVGFHLYRIPAVLPRTVELIKQFLITDAESFNSHAFYTSDSDPFKPNLFNSEGEEWKGYRTKMTPYFSPARIKAMVPIIKEVIDVFIKEIDNKLVNNVVEIDSLCTKLAIETIVSNVYGLQGDCFKNPDSFFVSLQKELLGLGFQLKSVLGFISETLYDLFVQTTFKKSTTNYLVSIISQVLESRLKGVGVRTDFMQGMIELYKKEMDTANEKTRNQDGTRVARFDRNRVVAQCMIMFSAGTDTSSHTLTWCLYELSLNPDIQERLRNEIIDTRSKSNGVIDNDEILNMTYLDMVVSEIMRKYPTAPFLFRKCVKTTRLGNVKIDKGTIVVMPIMGIHWDPLYYPNPEVFNPERFAPGVQRESGSYFPFGLGPRQCIGMKVAQMTIKLAICEILTKFRLTVCSKTPKSLKFDFGPILKPLNGLHLQFEHLDNSVM